VPAKRDAKEDTMAAIGSRGLRLALFAAALVSVAVLAAPAARAAEAGPFRLYAVKAPYDQVRQDLSDAITNRGLVVDHVSHIGAMLDRTAKAVGAKRRVYTHAEAYQFCSAVYSRRMMEADPRNIAFCPYIVFVYTTVDQPGAVRVGYRRPARTGAPASNQALRAVERLLDGIAREAAGLK
jgi:uncharacterized protein (DUF302 family)